LHQVVKYPQAFWVFTVLDIDQRADFCRLEEDLINERKILPTQKKKGLLPVYTYFECDVIVSDADLQLLFTDDIFLWPVCVVFPLVGGEGKEGKAYVRLRGKEKKIGVLDDLALLDDALQFLHHQRTDPH